MRIKSTVMIVMAVLWAAWAGCSAITTFDNPPETKISIDEELGDSLTVSLDNGLGTLRLLFTSDLPVDDSADIYAMIGNEITLEVRNTDNMVSVMLTDAPVDAAPASPGEYQVIVEDDRLSVAILFYNETATGQMMHEGGSYIAFLRVAQNDWFHTGDYTFNLTVE